MILVVLSNSVFTFNNQYFQRSKGISMGSNISVLLADIFVWRTIEEGLNLHHLNIGLWGRFIDDIIVVSNSPLFDSDLVLTKLHSGTSLRFTKEGPDFSVNFLDLTLSNCEGGFNWKPFYKPTRVAAFLDFNSNHSLTVKKAIILQKIHKLKSICSTLEIFESEKSKFRLELIDCNYPEPFINNQFKKISFNSINKNKTQFLLCGIPLILPYDNKIHRLVLKLINEFKLEMIKQYSNENFIHKLLPRLVFKNSPLLSSKLFKSRKLISVPI